MKSSTKLFIRFGSDNFGSDNYVRNVFMKDWLSPKDGTFQKYFGVSGHDQVSWHRGCGGVPSREELILI